MEPSGRTRGKSRSAVCALTLALLLAGASLPGTGPAQAGTEEMGKAHDPGLLSWPPNLRSPSATGEWKGRRTWLEGHGVTVSLSYLGEVFWNARGGIRTTNGGEYEGLFDLSVEFSTESAGLWQGGCLLFMLQQKHGRGITADDVGDFQVLSNMDALNFTQVSELWYRQSLLDGRIWIEIGKQDANRDFAGVGHGREFINSSAGFSPTIPLAAYPDQDLGVVLGVATIPWFSVKIGIYNGNPDGRRSLKEAFSELSGPMVLTEPAFHYDLGGRKGHMRAGGWFSDTEVDSPDEEDPYPETFGEDYGWYLTWDQELWREDPEDAENEQGIGLFGQYGWAPPDRNTAEHYIGAGIRCAGMIPHRDEDIAGVAVFHVRFSEEARLAKDTETSLEIFYHVRTLGFLFLQPDLQYIINPGGTTHPDALAVGLRFGLSL